MRVLPLVALALAAAACGRSESANPKVDPAAKPTKEQAAALPAPREDVSEADREALARYPKGTEPFRPRWGNGRIRAVGFICDGKPIGPCAYYDENGRIRSRGTYLYGALPDGEWEQWYDDGTKQSDGSYARGKEDGRWRYWHRDGTKAMEGTYDRGRKIGVWRSWHDNGERQSEGRFIDDRKVGRWDYWAPDGTTSGNVDYR